MENPYLQKLGTTTSTTSVPKHKHDAHLMRLSEIWMGGIKKHDEERAGRLQTLAKYIAGHAVTVVTDNNPAAITLRVGGELFVDERKDFPTVGLMARVTLAVEAGQHLNLDIDDIEPDSVTEIMAGIDRDDFYRRGKGEALAYDWLQHARGEG